MPASKNLHMSDRILVDLAWRLRRAAGRKMPTLSGLVRPVKEAKGGALTTRAAGSPPQARTDTRS
jgi:hypothetical protein